MAADAGWDVRPGEAGVRVRMYRVGFGDFFLLSFLGSANTPRHVVIDCGVFKGTSQTGDIRSIEAAVADMVKTTGGRVALVVMTHRHADHIAGFARCAEAFRQLEVGAVWMPVWESEYEPTAVKFQAELTRTALGLQQHFRALGASASLPEKIARSFVENAVGELDGAPAAATGSNAVALDVLKHGFAGVTPRYYKRGDKATLPQALAGLGLSAQILGPPPLEDLDLMKLMDLQKTVGQYLAGARPGEEGGPSPFGPEWEIDPARAPHNGEREIYAPDSFREWVADRHTSTAHVSREQAEEARRRMELSLQQSLPINALTAARQLNAFLNNQSLVLLFQFKGKKLLFVGDAQAGNWEHWLFNTDRPDKKASAAVAKGAREILASLDFYKVGHHGSGNATPRIAAEMMGTSEHRFASMCSTEQGVYGTEDPDDPAKGTEVPRGPLLERLGSESALVRSDQIAIQVNGVEIAPACRAPLPAADRGFRFEPGAVWVDCYL